MRALEGLHRRLGLRKIIAADAAAKVAQLLQLALERLDRLAGRAVFQRFAARLDRGRRSNAGNRFLENALLQRGRRNAVHRQAVLCLIGAHSRHSERFVVTQRRSGKESQFLELGLKRLDRLAAIALLERRIAVLRFNGHGRIGRRNGTARVQAFRKGQALLRRARIVELKNFAVIFAIIERHPLRAALAQSHAMPKAPEGQHKRVVLFAQADDFIAAAVDRQAKVRLQIAIGAQINVPNARLTVYRERHVQPQPGIGAARRGIARRMQLCRVDAHNARVVQPRRLKNLRLKSRRNRRAVLRDRRALDNAGGIFQIIGVILDRQVGRAAAPDVLSRFGLAAVAGGIVALRIAAAAHQADALRLVNGANRVGVGRRIAAKHLAGRAVGHVVAAARTLGAHGVGSGRNGLRLERLDGKAVRHFIRHHAVKIRFNINAQHRLNRAAARREDHIAAE